jgi:putative PIN family toxin of toxin-antitoxin system
LRLVLDTNVVLDLLHFADAAALPILHAIRSGRACCIVARAGLDEFERVLGYPRLKLDANAARTMLARYAALAECVPDPAPDARLPRCADADDQKFLDLAQAARADLLVSKDRAVLALRRQVRAGFRIVTPSGACEAIDPAQCSQ